MKFSLVLPAYNEAGKLEKAVNQVLEALKKNKIDFEILIAEDGSRDGTDKIAEKLADKYDKITHLHSDQKLGRGEALKRAFREAEGDIMGYIDVDLSVSPEYLPKLIKKAKNNDIVTGSRYLEDSKVERPWLREFLSKGYNWMIRVFLGCEIYDSQCGFKAFSREFVEEEIFNIEENSWAWDTAVIVDGIKKGYSFEEFPVKWLEKRKASHSTSLDRILSDLNLHGGMIWKLFAKWELGFNVDI